MKRGKAPKPKSKKVDAASTEPRRVTRSQVRAGDEIVHEGPTRDIVDASSNDSSRPEEPSTSSHNLPKSRVAKNKKSLPEASDTTKPKRIGKKREASSGSAGPSGVRKKKCLQKEVVESDDTEEAEGRSSPEANCTICLDKV